MPSWSSASPVSRFRKVGTGMDQLVEAGGEVGPEHDPDPQSVDTLPACEPSATAARGPSEFSAPAFVISRDVPAATTGRAASATSTRRGRIRRARPAAARGTSWSG